MPPPRFTNPPPKTESARSAVKAFYCELCQKGYARMNEWEAHEGSYDHQHRKRLKELSRMQRDPNASSKARERERKEDERSGIAGLSFKPVKLGSGSNAGEDGSAAAGSAPGQGLNKGFKKGGFKSAFASADVPVVVPDAGQKGGRAAGVDTDNVSGVDHVVIESESDEDGYDPRRPTGCDQGCTARI